MSKTAKETNIHQRHLHSENVTNYGKHLKGHSPGKKTFSSRIYGLRKKIKTPIKTSSNKKKSITKYTRLSSETPELIKMFNRIKENKMHMDKDTKVEVVSNSNDKSIQVSNVIKLKAKCEHDQLNLRSKKVILPSNIENGVKKRLNF